jgi:hypothetical protein
MSLSNSFPSVCLHQGVCFQRKMTGYMLIIHLRFYDRHMPAFLIRGIRLQAEVEARPNCRQGRPSKCWADGDAAQPIPATTPGRPVPNRHLIKSRPGLVRAADSGYNYLRDCTEIFEEDGWSVEHGSDRNDRSPRPTPNKRERLLRSWFRMNCKAE